MKTSELILCTILAVSVLIGVVNTTALSHRIDALEKWEKQHPCQAWEFDASEKAKCVSTYFIDRDGTKYPVLQVHQYPNGTYYLDK